MYKTLWNWCKDQRGAIAVIAALGLVAFAGVAALGVDLGHIVSVKGEMQKAADGAALNGAANLYDRSQRGIIPVDIWRWSTASTNATTTVQANSADGVTLTSSTVTTGFWDLTWTPVTAPASLLAAKTLASHVPAVKVVIQKSGTPMAGVNGGAVSTLFGPLLGKATADVNIQAVAVLTDASAVPPPSSPGPAFPLAVRKDFVVKYRGTTSTVHIRPDSPTNDPDDGHRGGQWTSFNFPNSSDRQEADYTATTPSSSNKAYIWHGNPAVLKVGDNAYIDSSKKATNNLYKAAKNRHIQEGDYTVILPVVASTVDMFNTNANKPIVGFIPFTITGVSDSSGEALAGGGGEAAGEAAGGGGGRSVEKCYTYLFIKGKFGDKDYVIPPWGGGDPGTGNNPGGGGGNEANGPTSGLFSGLPHLVK